MRFPVFTSHTSSVLTEAIATRLESLNATCTKRLLVIVSASSGRRGGCQRHGRPPLQVPQQVDRARADREQARVVDGDRGDSGRLGRRLVRTQPPGRGIPHVYLAAVGGRDDRRTVGRVADHRGCFALAGQKAGDRRGRHRPEQCDPCPLRRVAVRGSVRGDHQHDERGYRTPGEAPRAAVLSDVFTLEFVLGDTVHWGRQICDRRPEAAVA